MDRYSAASISIKQTAILPASLFKTRAVQADWLLTAAAAAAGDDDDEDEQ